MMPWKVLLNEVFVSLFKTAEVWVSCRNVLVRKKVDESTPKRKQGLATRCLDPRPLRFLAAGKAHPPILSIEESV